MLEAVQYYNSALNAILNYKKIEGIQIFQDYGAFAFDVVTTHEIQSNETQE